MSDSINRGSDRPLQCVHLAVIRAPEFHFKGTKAVAITDAKLEDCGGLQSEFVLVEFWWFTILVWVAIIAQQSDIDITACLTLLMCQLKLQIDRSHRLRTVQGGQEA